MAFFPRNHANTEKFNAKMSSNKKILKKVLKLHPKITKSTESIYIQVYTKDLHIFAQYFFRN